MRANTMAENATYMPACAPIHVVYINKMGIQSSYLLLCGRFEALKSIGHGGCLISNKHQMKHRIYVCYMALTSVTEINNANAVKPSLTRKIFGAALRNGPLSRWGLISRRTGSRCCAP